MDDGVQGARLLNRALDVLDEVIRTPGVTIAQLAIDTGIAPSSLYRIVRTLEERSLVTHYGAMYYPGPAMPPMAQAYGRAVLRPWLVAAHAPLMFLVQETGAAALLTLPAGDHGVVVARRDAHPGTSVPPFGPGRAFPLVAGAMGKVLLAHSSPSRKALSLREARGRRYADGSRINQESVWRELSEVSAQGYWFSHNEILRGTMGWFAPVLLGRKVVAGVGVVLPDLVLSRRSKDSLARLTVRSAGHLQQQWKASLSAG